MNPRAPVTDAGDSADGIARNDTSGPPVKVLLWHGYLLTGSGSNLYTANIARVWREAGHDVILMCQERDIDPVPWLDAVADFSADNKTFEFREINNQSGRGSCRLFRPNIGNVLPVYVFDEYEGFTPKTFVDLSDEELESYTESNVKAMIAVLESENPDAVITGHEVMGPFIALKACEATKHDYLAKLHGSALEYAVKKQERYVRYAHEGLCGAKTVVGGSNYMVSEASSVVSGWEDRAHVVNPGCDIELFKPADKRNAVPTVGYVGKWIAAKGVHHFLASLGRIDQDPLSAVVVGYGGYEEELRTIWDGLQRGDAETVSAVAEDPSQPLPHLLEWIGSSRMDDAYASSVARVDCDWAGRLDHGPLSQLLPTFDALVVPSVVPEAFGMVAAEAAACAVLPVVPRHSGIGEIGAALEDELDRPGLLTFDPDDPIEGIAAALNRVLGLAPDDRRTLEQQASAFARNVWSWEHVGDRLLELATN